MTRFVPYTSPGAYGITTSYWWCDRHGNRLEQLDPEACEAATITFNQDATIKRTLALNVNDSRLLGRLGEWLMPIVTISDPEGNHGFGPQGLYWVTPGGTSADAAGVTGTIEGRDALQIPVMATRDDLVWPSGMDGGAYCRQLAYQMGFAHTQVQIPDTGVAPAVDRPWDPGTTVYEAMTDVMTEGNHYAPWCSLAGLLISAPYRPQTEVASSWTYTNATDADAEYLEGAITESPDWDKLANRVTVRKLGYGDEPTVTESLVNDSPTSPVSTVNLGVTRANPPYDDITEWPEGLETEAEKRAWMKQKAQALLSERSSHLRKLLLPTFPDLFAEAHQVVGLEIRHGQRVTYTGNWWRAGWTLKLDGSATTMTQELRRVEQWQ